MPYDKQGAIGDKIHIYLWPYWMFPGFYVKSFLVKTQVIMMLTTNTLIVLHTTVLSLLSTYKHRNKNIDTTQHY